MVFSVKGNINVPDTAWDHQSCDSRWRPREGRAQEGNEAAESVAQSLELGVADKHDINVLEARRHGTQL